MIWTTEGLLGRSKAAALAVLAVALLAAPALFSTQALAADAPGDAAHGAKLFLQCRACHSVGQTDPNGVGPNLWGVGGSKAGSHPGYQYSAALSGSSIVWTPATLDQWLTQPTALAPGTKMAFQGIAAAPSRKDIIAYLYTLGPKVKVAPGVSHHRPKRKTGERLGPA